MERMGKKGNEKGIGFSSFLIRYYFVGNSAQKI